MSDTPEKPLFTLRADFVPTGDQPVAIEGLVEGLTRGERHQVLLGATGTGKTFTIANVIARSNRPTLVLAHNKTLAAQLYDELKEFFPENAVEYFVSYFDYYQPEAYLPRSDTYIEKDSARNDEIDKLRHSATTALFERRDVIIVASVSCIYGLGAPIDYGATVLRLRKGSAYRREAVLRHLVDLQYQRNDVALARARFRARGDTIEIVPAGSETAFRIELVGDEIERIRELDPVTGELGAEREELTIYPATHFVTPAEKLSVAIAAIEAEAAARCAELEAAGRTLEAARLRQRTSFDLEMMREVGYCSGIENYSRHLSGREPGSRPWTLLDYFPPDWLLVVDESHMAIPQVGGMYKNDRSRKEILVDFGFRLPSALDNRPLTFAEFEASVRQTIYLSATPGRYELEHAGGAIVEQLIRPTGIVDPPVALLPTRGQIDDLLARVRARAAKGERSIVTTLTKKMAEELASYMEESGIRVRYLHSEIDTLERVAILRDLRLGVYDAIVGINLLREGIDLPEVTLVAILDADKEGFLRSAWSLIQTIGRAARNTGGEVVLYADRLTDSMRKAIEETARRRATQIAYNRAHGIEPTSIIKPVRDLVAQVGRIATDASAYTGGELTAKGRAEVERLLEAMEAEMKRAAKGLEFERAAALRDELRDIRRRLLDEGEDVAIERRLSALVEPSERTTGRAAPAVRRVERAPAVGAAADWLVGLRDEHPGEVESGSETEPKTPPERPARPAPTWDPSITPNVIKRKGERPRRRR